MTRRPHILALTGTDLARDARVARQRAILRECGDTWSAALGPPTDGSDFIPLATPRRTRMRHVHSLARLLARQHAVVANTRYQFAPAGNPPVTWDLIVANDVDMLPLAFRLAQPHTRVLLDAHEYAPREFEDRLHWRILHQPHKQWLCRTYLSRIHGFITVCDGIADEYARVFHVPRPVVVPNAPPFHAGDPAPTSATRIRLVHHGLASRSRKLERMIEMMRHLDERFTLDLILVSAESGYLGALRAQAAGDRRIQFRAPVSATAIVEATRAYDVGVFLLPPTNFNYRFALPNKFFEFVQARLAVAIGPSPEMARLAREHDLGVIAGDFEPQTLARELNALGPAAIDRFKQAAHQAAPQLCWETVRETLRAEVVRLLPVSCAA